jgi:hypothetical protein
MLQMKWTQKNIYDDNDECELSRKKAIKNEFKRMLEPENLLCFAPPFYVCVCTTNTSRITTTTKNTKWDKNALSKRGENVFSITYRNLSWFIFFLHFLGFKLGNGK